MKMYYVILTSKKNDDESELLRTTDIQEAKERARDEAYYIERDGRASDSVEIRAYEGDREECFNYTAIEF